MRYPTWARGSKRIPRDAANRIPALPVSGGHTHFRELTGRRGSQLPDFQVENRLSTL